MSRRIVFFAHDLSNNAAGRVYVLWLLAKALGWQATVVAPKGEMWTPLRDSEFSADCIVLGDDRDDRSELIRISRAADLLIAVKPHPGSLGRALTAHKLTAVPLAADVDDPDLDVILHSREGFRTLRTIVAKPVRYATYRRLKRELTRLPVIVSNPVLAESYGGTIIPHVRSDSGDGEPHTSRSPHVVFVGTNRPHKGVGTLRRAVDLSQDVGAKLTVTDVEPADARAWESWVGPTSFEDGIKLVGRGDVVVIPTVGHSSFSQGQLPAKLIDAMIAGRAIVVTDLPTAVWATAGTAIVVPPDDPHAMATAIRVFSDPAKRSDYGSRARQRALQVFSTEALSERFREFCDAIVEPK